MTSVYCACGHDSEKHSDEEVCFGRVFLNQHGHPDFDGDEYQCKCKRYTVKPVSSELEKDDDQGV